jgi:nitrate/nitrite transport system substrate-binding protein
MAQYVRFGYLQQPPPFKEIADRLILQDLYREVASSMNIAIPDDDMKPFTLELDKVKFDPATPMGAMAA